MYRLILKNTGQSWPLTAEALVIGRGEACDVQVEDPLVSRVHCKVWARDGQAFVEDLGSSNATLMNGAPVVQAELQPGDTLGLGACLLQVAEESVRTAEATPAEQATVDFAEALAGYQQPLDTKQPYPASVEEYRALFLLGQALSAAQTPEELVDALKPQVAPMLKADAAWLVQYSPRGQHLVQPLGEAGAFDLLDELQRAIEERQAILVPRVLREGAVRRVETTMIAPVCWNARTLGAIAVRSHTRHRIFDEHDLRFLGAAAHTIAGCWQTADRMAQLERDFHQLRRDSGETADIIGESPALLRAIAQARLVADTHLSVLLLGESGTGKELFARLIHRESGRASAPFIAINCAAIQPSLFESEMLGHEAGAFTGATRRHRGWFEEAHGGTLFLDEIGDLHPDNQARILRAIETGTFYRVGGRSAITADVRVIAATNQPLAELIEEKAFRVDLYHRLAGFQITLPPLRERIDDIPLLARAFLDQFIGHSLITDAALQRLRAWPWPGNIRELKACIERAIILAHGGEIREEHLQLTGEALPASPAAKSPTETPAAFPKGPIPTLAEIEMAHIRAVVAHCNGNLRAAARTLGIARATLYRKLGSEGAEIGT